MNRILLVGCPRSGTTLLQSMLGTHSDLLTFTESHFFPTYFQPRRKGRPFAYIRPELLARTEAFLSENGFAANLRPRIRTGRIVVPTFKAQARRCLEMFDAMAQVRSKSAWLEKTPDNLHRLSLLQSISPEIKIIHIIREPGPAILSLSKASQFWGEPLDLHDAAAKWRRDVETSLRYRGHEHHFFVLYEDLVAGPETVLASLFAQLDLAPDRYLLKDYTSVAEKVIGAGESWKANNRRAVATVDRSTQVDLPLEIAGDVRESFAKVYQAAKAAAGSI